MSLTDDLDRALLMSDGRPVPAMGWATVTQASPLRVRIDGETTPLPITPDTIVKGLLEDQHVAYVRHGKRLLLLGRHSGDVRLLGTYRPSGSTSVANTTTTKIPMAVTERGASLIDSGDVVVPIAGDYHVDYRLAGPNAGGTYRVAYLYVNGASTEHSSAIYPPGSTFRFTDSATLTLAAGDRLSLWASQDSGGALSVGSVGVGSDTLWARLTVRLVRA